MGKKSKLTNGYCWIRFLRDWRRYVPGDIIQFPKGASKLLIRRGLCENCSGPASVTKQSTTRGKYETASMPNSRNSARRASVDA